MIEAIKQDPVTGESELIREIQRYLAEFNSNLLDGDSVRDALLDLMQLAKKEQSMLVKVRSQEEIEAELAWVVSRHRQSVKTQNWGEERMTGSHADSLMYWYFSGDDDCLPGYSPRMYDMVAIFNVFNTAPEHVQPMLEPIVARWKVEAFGEDDRISEVKPPDEWSPADLEYEHTADFYRYYEGEQMSHLYHG